MPTRVGASAKVRLPRVDPTHRPPAALQRVADSPGAAPTELLEPAALAGAVRALGWDAPAAALSEHAALLSELCCGPNAAQALRAHRSLLTLALPADVHATLVLGVARARTASTLGSQGVLTAAQAMQAGRAFAGATASLRSRVVALLERAKMPAGPEADGETERALILKALAARAGRARPYADLEPFARAIRGVPRYALIACTTLLDLDATRRTSRTHTRGLIDKHPLLAPKPKVRADADGLLQLYESSCGPTSVETLRGELDPIYAWSVHMRGGAQSVVERGLSDDFQRAWLRHFGEAPRRRRGMHDYLRVGELSEKLVASGLASRRERFALLRYCRSSKHELTATAAAALEQLRQAFGFPSEHEVERMRSSFPAAPTKGTDDVQLSEVLHAVLTPASGVRYRFANRVADGLRPGDAELLARELDVSSGLVLGTTDHWWALLEARPSEGGYDFLIHDPWTGITALVPQAELYDGTFQRTRFGWPRKGLVDGFYVTERESGA